MVAQPLSFAGFVLSSARTPSGPGPYRRVPLLPTEGPEAARATLEGLRAVDCEDLEGHRQWTLVWSCTVEITIYALP